MLYTTLNSLKALFIDLFTPLKSPAAILRKLMSFSEIRQNGISLSGLIYQFTNLAVFSNAFPTNLDASFQGINYRSYFAVLLVSAYTVTGAHPKIKASKPVIRYFVFGFMWTPPIFVS